MKLLIFFFTNRMRENCPRYGVITGPYFPLFVLNTKIHAVNFHIQSEYRKIRTRNNYWNTFYAVKCSPSVLFLDHFSVGDHIKSYLSLWQSLHPSVTFLSQKLVISFSYAAVNMWIMKKNSHSSNFWGKMFPKIIFFPFSQNLFIRFFNFLCEDTRPWLIRNSYVSWFWCKILLCQKLEQTWLNYIQKCIFCLFLKIILLAFSDVWR